MRCSVAAPPRKGKPPKFVPPQLAELHKPRQKEKCGGMRSSLTVIARDHLGKGGARVFTRNGRDWTTSSPSLLPPFADLPADTALIDGEIVAGAGLERFGDVPRAIEHGGPFVFYAFDLLALEGKDLTSTLATRRAALDKLFADVHPRAFSCACRRCWRARGPTCSPRWDVGARGWSQNCETRLPLWSFGGMGEIQVERRGAFVIVGWQHSTARGKPFASLLLAAQENGALVYRGRSAPGLMHGPSGVMAQLTPAGARILPPRHPPALRAKITWSPPRI